jgi:hypothetical protein
MVNGYESDSSGCSYSSEDLIVIASAVSAAFVFMSKMHTCTSTDTDSNRTLSGTRGGPTPGFRHTGNRERRSVDGAARIDADYFRKGDIVR